jgi:hypothetical protein
MSGERMAHLRTSYSPKLSDRRTSILRLDIHLLVIVTFPCPFLIDSNITQSFSTLGLGVDDLNNCKTFISSSSMTMLFADTHIQASS